MRPFAKAIIGSIQEGIPGLRFPFYEPATSIVKFYYLVPQLSECLCPHPSAVVVGRKWANDSSFALDILKKLLRSSHPVAAVQTIHVEYFQLPPVMRCKTGGSA